MDHLPEPEANKLEPIKSPTTLPQSQPLQISQPAQAMIVQAPLQSTVMATIQSASSSPQPKSMVISSTSNKKMELLPKPEDSNKLESNNSSTTVSQSQPQQISQPVQPIIVQAPLQTIMTTVPSSASPQPKSLIVPGTSHKKTDQLPKQEDANKFDPIKSPATIPQQPLQIPQPNLSKISQPEPNKYICCLLDNGVRCERVAGNASFSARIQKTVATKKVNLTLDPAVRHAYICDQHKSILTVAKKSTPVARYAASNNTNTLSSQSDMNFNDFTMRQQALQHPVNLDLLANQNRLTNNHNGTINMKQGPYLAFSHYPTNHQNQVGFDPSGGDSVPSSSGGIDVDLQQLQVNTLRRYKRHFRVQTRPGLNKMQLAESLKSHFRTLPIIEKEAITYFVYIVKCYRNKLDHNPKAD